MRFTTTVLLGGKTATALDAAPAARRRFDAMSYSHQLQHVLAATESKTEATRDRRVAAVLAAMDEG